MRGQHWEGVSQCNENASALMSLGSPHTSYCTLEGLKVGRHHGNMVGSASHSEQHNAILYLWPTLEPLQWDREKEWQDT
jgi:hypothetical protein